MNPKNLLIVCYSFPPNPGIGGRRWVKFAKYFVRAGYKINVLTAKPSDKSSQSVWTKDIPESENFKVYFFERKFPGILEKIPQNIFQKLKYKFFVKKRKLICEGNFYDRVNGMQEYLTEKAASIVRKENISCLITTGGPFHLTSHMVHLKDEFPMIKIVSDLRDVWTILSKGTWFDLLSEKAKAQELKLEESVFYKSDIITVVAEKMQKEYVIKYPFAAHKIQVFPNGFDPDDIKVPSLQKEPNLKKFIFAGSLYDRLDYVFTPFLEALVELKKENFELYNKLEFNFYGNQNILLKKKLEDCDLEKVNFHKSIPLDSALQKIADSDYCMLFIQKNLEFSLSTKFCEYLAHGKYIVIFSDPGETTQLIEDKKIGVHLPGNKEKIKKGLIKLASYNITSGDFAEELANMSIKNISSKLTTAIENITPKKNN